MQKIYMFNTVFSNLEWKMGKYLCDVFILIYSKIKFFFLILTLYIKVWDKLGDIHSNFVIIYLIKSNYVWENGKHKALLIEFIHVVSHL